MLPAELGTGEKIVTQLNRIGQSNGSVGINKLGQGDFQYKFAYFIVCPGLAELHLQLYLYWYISLNFAS